MTNITDGTNIIGTVTRKGRNLLVELTESIEQNFQHIWSATMTEAEAAGELVNDIASIVDGIDQEVYNFVDFNVSVNLNGEPAYQNFSLKMLCDAWDGVSTSVNYYSQALFRANFELFDSTLRMALAITGDSYAVQSTEAMVPYFQNAWNYLSGGTWVDDAINLIFDSDYKLRAKQIYLQMGIRAYWEAGLIPSYIRGVTPTLESLIHSKYPGIAIPTNVSGNPTVGYTISESPLKAILYTEDDVIYYTNRGFVDVTLPSADTVFGSVVVGTWDNSSEGHPNTGRVYYWPHLFSKSRFSGHYYASQYYPNDSYSARNVSPWSDYPIYRMESPYLASNVWEYDFYYSTFDAPVVQLTEPGSVAWDEVVVGLILLYGTEIDNTTHIDGDEPNSVDCIPSLYYRNWNTLTVNNKPNFSLPVPGVAVTQPQAQDPTTNINNPDDTFLFLRQVLPLEEVPTQEVDDPYTPGGTTDPETGDFPGDWTLPVEDIETPISPVDSTQAGVFRSFAMTKSQLSSMAQKLWSPNLLQQFLNGNFFDIFGKPIDLITGIMEYPFVVTPHEENPEQINFSWWPQWNTWADVATGYPLTDEYQHLSFGNIEIGRYSGTFYDYQPYTQAHLYLPYIGFVPLKMNEIVNSTLSLEYVVSLTTGAFSAIVEAYKEDEQTPEGRYMTLGVYTGTIGRPLPLSARDLHDAYLTIGATVIAAAAGAAALGAAAGVAASSLELSSASAGFNAALSMGSIPEAQLAYQGVETAIEHLQGFQHALPAAGRRFAALSGNAAKMALAANEGIQRSGSIGALAGRTTPHKPFLMISTVHQNVSELQSLLGYSTNAAGFVGDFTGYTEFRQILYENISCLSDELTELDSLVRGGIIL